MTNAITYPAAYNVLSCEEMTYTEGGVGVVEAAMAWFPLYGWYKAVSAIHDYRKANINSNWVENGMTLWLPMLKKAPRTPSMTSAAASGSLVPAQPSSALCPTPC